MADIRRFVPRFVPSRVEATEAKPILIACHCQSTSFEVMSTQPCGVMRCARCHCLLPVIWEWAQESSS